MNYDAQPLTVAERTEIKASPRAIDRLLTSYALQLDFYGLALDKATGAVQRSEGFRARFDNLQRSFHNNLRITRILKCLGEFGYEHFKPTLVRFFAEEIKERGELTSCAESLRNYWVPVLRSADERQRILDYLDGVPDGASGGAAVCGGGPSDAAAEGGGTS